MFEYVVKIYRQPTINLAHIIEYFINTSTQYNLLVTQPLNLVVKVRPLCVCVRVRARWAHECRSAGRVVASDWQLILWLYTICLAYAHSTTICNVYIDYSRTDTMGTGALTQCSNSYIIHTFHTWGLDCQSFKRNRTILLYASSSSLLGCNCDRVKGFLLAGYVILFLFSRCYCLVVSPN